MTTNSGQYARLYRLSTAMLVAGVSGTVLVPGEAGAQNQQRCFQLEQQLQRLGSSGLSRQAQASRARSELRRVNRDYRRAQGRADRLSCYSTFFFTETLRKTARCVRLDRQIRRLGAKRSRLRGQLAGASRPSNRRAQRNQIVRALARNRCGAIYQREARRTRSSNGWNPFASVFGDGFGGGFFDNAPRELPPDDGIRVGSTYRTMCVRQCDGYYYPVSFSTLPSRFQRDASQCATSCAAPTELFVYRNPGAEVEQMVSLDGRAYAKSQNAFRYRKEYIKGCSCRASEYNPLAGTGQAADAATGGPAAEGETPAVEGDAPAALPEGGTAQPAPPRVPADKAKTPANEAAIQSPIPARPAPPKPSSVASAEKPQKLSQP